MIETPSPRSHPRLALLACLPSLLVSAPGAAADYERSTFGLLPDGRPVEAVRLRNTHGVSVRLIALGAAIQSLEAPDRHGGNADIVLGYATVADYLNPPHVYFGATVGRYAGRISNARFTLDSHAYPLTANDPPNSLHGGVVGFDRALWTVARVSRGADASVELRYLSKDSEEGYPGNLTVSATYRLSEANELAITYRATTDKPTIVNITNHSYFNLSGEGSANGVLHHDLTLYALQYLPIDAGLIPTGEFRAVTDTPFDFRQPKPIGRDIRASRDKQIMYAKGYDHDWVASLAAAPEARLVARVHDPDSGRVLEVLSDQPSVHFYLGDAFNGAIVGKAGFAYRQEDGFAIEPGKFGDTPNRAEFGSARLDPGETYVNRIVYRFSVASSDKEGTPCRVKRDP